MANYFDNATIEKMVTEVGGDLAMLTYDEMDTVIAFTQPQLKALMNLAVDTAKGEPEGFVTDELGGFVLNHYVKLANCFPPLEHPDTKWTPLYEIKELPNG